MRAACRGLVPRGASSLSLHCDDATKRLLASFMSSDALDLYQDVSSEYRRHTCNAVHLAMHGEVGCKLRCTVDDKTLAQPGLRSMHKNVASTIVFPCTGQMHKVGSSLGTLCRVSCSSSAAAAGSKEHHARLSRAASMMAVHSRSFSCSLTRRHDPSDTRAVVSTLLKERHASTGTTGNQKEDTEGKHNGGWTYEEIVNVPNALSAARLVSGPIIGTLILNGEYTTAVPILFVSSATDWLDGYFARIQQRNSVLGSYLDPLADKVLIGCVVGALGYTGDIPLPLVGIIIARDAFLVTGAFAARAKALDWTWPGWKQFFNMDPSAAGTAKNARSTPPAPKVKPLLISKVNTGMQLWLVASCMTHAWVGWPSVDFNIWVLGSATACTTVWSCLAYLQAYMNGSITLASRQ